VVNEENEDYAIIAYVLNRMASMEPEVFVTLLDDTIHDGPQALEKIRRIVAQVRNDIEAYENQNNEQPTPEDITPAQEDNSDEIASLLAQTQDQLLSTPENERPQPKRLEDMEVDELNNELQTALDLEDYDRAVQIRDILKAR
jgi:cysteinyl-tRNA synthetase